MKTQNAKPIRSRASVLIVVLSVVAVSAIALASYLTLVQGQAASVARSQSWNYIIPIAEAGIEDGLAMVNDGAPQIIINQWAWTNNTSADGWSGPSNNKWTMTRYVSGSNYYTATIDISSGAPVVTSVGVVPYTSLPWKFSALGQPMMAAVGSQQSTLSTANLGRKIQALTVLNPLFNAAILTRSNLNLNGNNVTVDSFDSSSSLYSTLGQWDPLKRQANGDVATDSSVVGDVSLGNGNIYGHVYTGPGTAQSAVQIGPNGAVGNVAWNTASSGIETGYWSGDFNLSIPDVQAPASGTTTLPSPTNGNVVLNGGTYTISPTTDPNISKPIIVMAPTIVWVQGSYTPPLITIASTNTNNASLALYVGRTSGSGDSLSLGGNGTVNQPGYAQTFQIYGLPSLTSISLSGNAGMIATIYAPEANASFNGGGNNVTDVSGSIVVNSLTMNGHFNVHYDQNLRVKGPSRGWVPNKWTEMKYP
jgi:hypothetical protein